MSKGKDHNVPRVPLHPNDIQVIDIVLVGYIGYLRNTTKFTEQEVLHIQQLEDLQRRLSWLVQSGEQHAVFMTVDDIRAIREALLIFGRIMRQIVPQSKERDETLKATNALRKHVEKHLFRG